MQKNFVAASLLLLTVLPGCSGLNVAAFPLGGSSTLFTQADTRMIISAPSNLDPFGKNRPAQITCAEPSPDVAKAVEAAFGTSASIAANNAAANLSGEGAAALSASRAEAIAQLGERMASIQLLRDGLFRACEAYMNGALSPTSYALVLSRYGDTMVTLLGSELVAGEFGRSGAAVGGSGSGSGSGATGAPNAAAASAANDAVANAQKGLSDAQAKLTADSTSLAGGSTTVTAATVQGDAQGVVDATNTLASAQKAAAEVNAASASANSQAQGSGSGIGAITKSLASDAAANRIADMVRGYINTPTIHSIMTACIATLEDNARAWTNFGTFCRESMSGFTLALRQGYDRSIDAVSAANADADFRHTAGRIERLQQLVTQIKTVVDGGPGRPRGPPRKPPSPPPPANEPPLLTKP